MMSEPLIVAILGDFEQIARLIGRERFGSPVIQDEQFGARQGAQEPGVARIPMGEGQIVLPRPLAPVTSRLRRFATRSQAASSRK